MLVVVRRKQVKSGEWVFYPVDALSFNMLFDATSCSWFYASQWQPTLERLQHWFGDVKMTNRWFHIQRRREPGFYW